jgi:hypothetical protein
MTAGPMGASHDESGGDGVKDGLRYHGTRQKSDFRSFGQEQCIVDVETEIADGVLDLAIT